MSNPLSKKELRKQKKAMRETELAACLAASHIDENQAHADVSAESTFTLWHPLPFRSSTWLTTLTPQMLTWTLLILPSTVLVVSQLNKISSFKKHSNL